MTRKKGAVAPAQTGFSHHALWIAQVMLAMELTVMVPPDKPFRIRFGAGNEARTRDPQLGKLMLCQLSYSRLLPPQRSGAPGLCFHRYMVVPVCIRTQCARNYCFTAGLEGGGLGTAAIMFAGEPYTGNLYVRFDEGSGLTPGATLLFVRVRPCLSVFVRVCPCSPVFSGFVYPTERCWKW